MRNSASEEVRVDSMVEREEIRAKRNGRFPRSGGFDSPEEIFEELGSAIGFQKGVAPRNPPRTFGVGRRRALAADWTEADFYCHLTAR